MPEIAARLFFTMPQELRRELDAYLASNDISFSKLMQRLVREYLESKR